MTAAPRTLLADDHMMVAEGLNRLLADHCQMVGTVLDGTSLVEAAVDLQPDLIIADLSMPGLSGLDAITQLRERGVASKIIILTMYADPRIAKEAIAAGAVGFVSKHAAGQELVDGDPRSRERRNLYESAGRRSGSAACPSTEKPLARLTPAAAPGPAAHRQGISHAARLPARSRSRRGPSRRTSTRSCACSASRTPRISFATQPGWD